MVDRETLPELLKILDPEGVELRAKRSLKRRQYSTRGPNFYGTWTATISWNPLVSTFMEPSTELAGEFYGSMLASQTMILPLFVSTLLTVCDNLGEQQVL